MGGEDFIHPRYPIPPSTHSYQCLIFILLFLSLAIFIIFNMLTSLILIPLIFQSILWFLPCKMNILTTPSFSLLSSVYFPFFCQLHFYVYIIKDAWIYIIRCMDIQYLVIYKKIVNLSAPK